MLSAGLRYHAPTPAQHGGLHIPVLQTHQSPVTSSGAKHHSCLLPLLAILALFYLSHPTLAAHYHFDTWTTSDGLPQNTIRKIVQTPDGYLWFTTFDGLVRFDGVKFTVFDRGNTPGIASNRFVDLLVDRYGTLWATTEDRTITICRNNNFTSITGPDEVGADKIRPPTLACDFNGDALVRTSAGYYQLRNKRFVRAPRLYNRPGVEFHAGPSGTQWFADRTGITRIDGRDRKTTHYALSLGFKDPISDIRMFEDYSGALWISDTVGLYRLTGSTIRHFDERDGVPHGTWLRPHCQDQDGAIWFAADPYNQVGVGVVRFSNGSFTRLDSADGLSNNIVAHIFTDREGNVWVATSLGLNRVRPQIITTFSTADGLPSNEVYPILHDGLGDIWVGTVEGLCHYQHGHFISIARPRERFYVQSLWREPNGRLWIGTFDGLYCYENNAFLNGGAPLLANIVPATIAPDRSGNIWVGTNRGAYLLHDGKIVETFTTESGLPDNDVKVIHVDQHDIVWLGTYGGLARYQMGRFKRYTTSDGLVGNRIRSIHEDTDGTLWIGTYDEGLSRLRNETFTNYTTRDGLFNNGVFCILDDGRGSFWISCNRGIYQVRRQQLEDFAAGRIGRITSIAYGTGDGMVNSECNGGRQPAGIRTTDGKLWIPTMGGVAVVDPTAVHINTLPPPVHIESISLDRRIIDHDGDIVIEPGQNDLEIRYTAMSFTKPDQVRFRYRLEEKDETWTEAETRRIAYFSYLPPGRYTFRVVAANKDGIWNETGATVAIVVMAPVWQRWWFTASVGVVIAVGVVAAYQTRIRSFEKRRRVQEEFARRLIESQESERKRIATELHDSLGQSLLVIKNWSLVGLNLEQAGSSTREPLSGISEAASSALDEVRQIAQNLRPYQLERFGLTSSIEAMMQQMSASSFIHFDSFTNNIDGVFPKEWEISIYRIVQECLNNVIKHSDASRASLEIERTDDGAAITCWDNGRGFDMEAIERNGRRGLGLVSLTERVHLLGGSLFIHSTPGKGTTVSIRMTTTSGNSSITDHSIPKNP